MGVPLEVAVILAGGGSRRMGEEKALLDAGGVTFLERRALQLEGFEELYVSVAHEGASPGLRRAIERAARRLGREIIVLPDGRGGEGPLEGVRTVLERARRLAFFVPVDVPEVHLPLVTELLRSSAAQGRAGCVPRWAGGLEPAYAAFGPSLLPVIDELFGQGRSSLQSLASLPQVEVLDLEDESVARRVLGKVEPSRLFTNVNTPEEYARWRSEGGPT